VVDRARPDHPAQDHPRCARPPGRVLSAVDGAALLASAERLLGDDRVLLGITGPPGAGKTTVSEWLVERLNRGAASPIAAYVPMDGFHLANLVLHALGLRNRKGAPETFDAAGFAALLRRLRAAEQTVYAPRFHREIEESIAAEIAVEPDIRLVVVEGNYLLLDRPAWRPVREALHEVWYLDAPEDVLATRLLDRRLLAEPDRALAQAWLDDNDLPNARLIAESRGRADAVFEVAPLPA
jgi:pantothenate kinase